MKIVNILNTCRINLFRSLIKPFIGTGLGKYRLISRVYEWMMNTLLHSGPITVNKYQMYLSQKVYSRKDPIVNELQLKGVWEPYTTDVFQKLLTRGIVFVDIGANIGYFTLLAASKIGIDGTVYAFEPEPENFSLLLKNIKLNEFKNIKPFQKAIAESTGKMQLYLGTSSGTHSLFSVVETTEASIEVDVISLDEFFKELDVKPDIIKLDVQGSEIIALKGMHDIVNKNDDLILVTEFETDMEHSEFTPKIYWDYLLSLGFNNIYLINEEDRKFELTNFQTTIEFLRSKHINWINLFCAKKPIDPI
jgi:FkbM family methyltransferase